ncbi:MAG: PEP-CTERM sorting domain-containing protein [Phycisphaeraceae bacterium]|nr:PEP-CTERM sorting domain-containing protein [Phycisphaerae bacterium]MBX3393239.1 PEP-CTERM sorting domain-containing protein [Phycisphaeraceae bacterium]
MRLSVVPGIVVAAVSLPASAAIFSFPSDADHTSWTFTGVGASVADAADPFDPQVLLIDDDNGPMPPHLLGVEFDADFELSYLGSLPFVAGKFTHTYVLNGSFVFSDPVSGAPILSCVVRDGLFSTVGNGGLKPPTWDSTATIQASDDYGIVIYTWHGPDDPAYGLFTGQSIDIDTAAFTLTVLRTEFGAGVALDDRTFLPLHRWYSEGSYSGSAYFVPSPGALALAGMGLLVAGRRRRCG